MYNLELAKYLQKELPDIKFYVGSLPANNENSILIRQYGDTNTGWVEFEKPRFQFLIRCLSYEECVETTLKLKKTLLKARFKVNNIGYEQFNYINYIEFGKTPNDEQYKVVLNYECIISLKIK